MRYRALVLLAPVFFLAACQSSGSSNSAQAADAAALTRDEGYGLLYSTISDECGVDKVLIIKSPAPQAADLVKAIGQFARDSKSTLQNLAKEDPAIALDKQGLPEVEVKTREAISSATSKQILFSSGKELEFRLLVTQLEALNYITQLATTLADQDPRENRKRYLAMLAKESAALRDRVLGQLMTPYVGTSK